MTASGGRKRVAAMDRMAIPTSHPRNSSRFGCFGAETRLFSRCSAIGPTWPELPFVSGGRPPPTQFVLVVPYAPLEPHFGGTQERRRLIIQITDLALPPQGHARSQSIRRARRGSQADPGPMPSHRRRRGTRAARRTDPGRIRLRHSPLGGGP